MNVMLLAAGEGTRLRPYTTSLPKPAIPFLTVPLAAYSISLIDRLKIKNLVINTHHLPTHIEYLFKDLKLPPCNLKFSSEKDLLLGSGGGIHAAENFLLGGDFLVMNGDEVILPNKLGIIEDLIYFHQTHKPIATLLTMNHLEVGKKFGGAWTLDGVHVDLFSKQKPSEKHQGHHFVGGMILSESVFQYFKPQVEVENILYETLTLAMSKGEKVLVFNVDCTWFESGNAQDLIAATDYCLDQIRQNKMDYWVEYLKQVIRVYGQGQSYVEKDFPQTLQKLKQVFSEQQFNYLPDKNEPFSL